MAKKGAKKAAAEAPAPKKAMKATWNPALLGPRSSFLSKRQVSHVTLVVMSKSMSR